MASCQHPPVWGDILRPRNTNNLPLGGRLRSVGDKRPTRPLPHRRFQSFREALRSQQKTGGIIPPEILPMPLPKATILQVHRTRHCPRRPCMTTVTAHSSGPTDTTLYRATIRILCHRRQKCLRMARLSALVPYRAPCHLLRTSRIATSILSSTIISTAKTLCSMKSWV